jgi:hypothetical protein
MWTIDLPVFIDVTPKKRLALNLNGYRNWHHRDQHKTKTMFDEIVRPLLSHIPKQEKIHLHYELFVESKRRCDLMNVIAVVDKYFSDTLSHTSAIDDDHTGIIVSTSAAFGGVDRPNPRVCVTIIPVECPIAMNLS